MRFSTNIILFFLTINALGQSISGYIYDENNQPVPTARIQVKFNSNLNTISGIDGKYFIRTEPGVYDLIISSIGYETQTIKATIENDNVVKHVYLKINDKELGDLVVKSRRRDPAYEIIQSAIKNKTINYKSVPQYSCSVYIKAKEEVEKKFVPKKEEEKDKGSKVAETFEEKNDENEPFQSNFSEIHLKLDYAYPNRTKETRSAVKNYGRPFSLFYTTTTDANFSVYQNLIYLRKISETPLISPLNATAILHYKFKLDSIITTKEYMVYKILVTPRKKGNATLTGTIWIQDKSFAVTQCDLSLRHGTMYKYDNFSFTQNFVKQDSIWLMNEQSFSYGLKNRKETRKGYTIAEFSKYDLTVDFPKRYFGNELGVTTEEAYERDSSYWKSIRPRLLSIEEQDFMRKKDSIYELQHSEVFLDSIDSVFNKIKITKIIYDGIDHRIRDKRVQWGLGSLVDMIEPFDITGVRVGPNFYYFKKFENEKTIWSSGNIDLGVRNLDIKGGAQLNHLYSPMHVGRITVAASHNFSTINQYDAYLNYVKKANYIENTRYQIRHQHELFNGMYAFTNLYYDDRRPIGNYKFGPLVELVSDGEEAIKFDRYQALRTSFQLQYVIGQQYLNEPKRKIILGSKGPTVYAYYEKGWNNVLGSDINFDYMGFGILQTFAVRTMGTSKYFIKTGKFMNTKDLRYVDWKFFRQSDPFLFSNALYSFQLLPESFPTRKLYLEGHYIHHFNGTLANFIPLVKKLKVQFLTGVGTLYLPEFDDFTYQELYFGVERVNKILRRRVRIGLYYIMATYTDKPFDSTFKISFDVLNERRNTWNF